MGGPSPNIGNVSIVRPVTLKYDFGGVTAQVALNVPPNGTDGCTIVGGPNPSGNPGPSQATMGLLAGQWGGSSLTVYIVSFSGFPVAAADLSYLVVGTSGTIFFSGAAGTSPPQAGTTTTITYNDAAGSGMGFVGADDNIAIIASPNADQLHGTTFKVLVGADVLGTVVIP